MQVAVGTMQTFNPDESLSIVGMILPQLDRYISREFSSHINTESYLFFGFLNVACSDVWV